MASKPHVEVTVLGGGIGGSMLALILARQGVSVRLLEAGVHPQFAIGESMIPETGAWFRLMSMRYDLPELDHLSTFQGVRHHVSSQCGVKRAFSYVYHREGQLPRTRELMQFPTLAPPLGPDTHFFRQDIDAWLMAAAVRHGAEVVQRCKITTVEREGEGWVLHAEDGQQHRSRFLVDGSGYRSPLAKLYELRDEPCRLRTNSRSIFTHMTGVRAYDAFLPKNHGMLYPFSQSTLHHVFDGGWMWVIPFDNHRASTNPLCSVGLMLDRDKFPDDDRPAQEQFETFIARYPGMAPQFAHARAVRPWVATGRIQYSSKRIRGPGFCVLPHAAGFIDPLFSSGLGFMAWSCNELAATLIACSRDGDWSEDRFERVEIWTQKHLDHFDKVVSGAYRSFHDVDLWNAWYRVWCIGNFFGASTVMSRYMMYNQTGDRALLEFPKASPHRGFGSADFPDYQDLLAAARQVLDRVEAGERTSKQGSEDIFALLAARSFWPTQFQFEVPSHRVVGSLTVPDLLRLFLWTRTRAPAHIRQAFWPYGQMVVWRYVFGALWTEARRALGSAFSLLRDELTPWNEEWRKQPGAIPGWEENPPALTTDAP